jgi:hypothetical protein
VARGERSVIPLVSINKQGVLCYNGWLTAGGLWSAGVGGVVLVVLAAISVVDTSRAAAGAGDGAAGRGNTSMMDTPLGLMLQSCRTLTQWSSTIRD